MRKVFLLWICLLLAGSMAQGQDDFLSQWQPLEGVELEVLPAGSIFKERYLLWIEQPIDHVNPAMGSFRQRVVLNYVGRNNPLVFNTEGYNIDDPQGVYLHELSEIFQANQIDVEHRYYPPSSPSNRDWKYLTVSNAAADHHRIVQLLKPFFSGPWIGTGISKGGQAAMYHRAYYPDDVDITVGYVCPLAFSQEDLRVYDFLRNVGDDNCRMRIREFQELLLRERDKFMPFFIKEAGNQDLQYRIGFEKAYELLVMEYAFAFWQWGLYDCAQIPLNSKKPKSVIAHLDSIASLDWVSDGFLDNNPFFYQALTEIGMYGYDTSGWNGLLQYLDDPTFRFVCPPSYTCDYHPTAMQEVDAFIRHRAKRMIFIYGEYDPWTATAVQWSGNEGVKVMVKKGGSHLTRINNFPQEQKAEILALLRTWLLKSTP